MRKCVILLLLVATLLLSACAADGDPVPYEKEHEHVYGFWYDATPEEGEDTGVKKVRYCKICHEPQLGRANGGD